MNKYTAIYECKEQEDEWHTYRLMFKADSYDDAVNGLFLFIKRKHSPCKIKMEKMKLMDNGVLTENEFIYENCEEQLIK